MCVIEFAVFCGHAASAGSIYEKRGYSMKKVSKFLCLFLALALILGMMPTAFAADSPYDSLNPGPNVIKDANSPTGYTVKFLYENEAATTVIFKGDLGLRDWAADQTSNAGSIAAPQDYKPGMMRCSGFEAPMTKLTEGKYKGFWYYELPLAAGANQYWFTVDGGTRMMPDPNNMPIWSPRSDSNMKDAYNVVYVPYDEKQNFEPLKARTAELPREDEKKGTWSYVSTEYGGNTHYMGVYLPYGYDENRAEPYKTIYVLHGGGQDESDWMGIGSVQNIMDNLAAEGKTEPAVIVSVTSDNGMLGDAGFFGMSNYDNVKNELIPFIEKNYHVSKEAKNRAWMGLSMGSMNAQNMINANAPLFGYYGCFSGGCSISPETKGLDQTHIVIGYGSNDTVATMSDTLQDSIQALNDAGGYCKFEYVCGGHDFNTWCQMFRILCEKYLWKPAAFDDAECEHEFEKTVTKPTCTEGGYTTSICKKCGKKLISDKTAPNGHEWDEGSITVAPTQTGSGERTFHCLHCTQTKVKKIPCLSFDKTEGPKVEKDEASPTGYTVKFVYKNEAAQSVIFHGDLALRNAEDPTDTNTYTPFEYRPGLMRGAAFEAPMEEMGDGYWYYELPLCAGANQYWFTVDGNPRMMPDPANPPVWSPRVNPDAKDAYNVVYVPYDEKQNYAPLKARTAELPREDEKRGTWSYVSTVYGGFTQYMGVYLPYGYDKDREKPYKTIYVLHGFGQDESDWMGIGSVQNIMDNLAAEGKTEPAVIVSVTSDNNMLGEGGFFGISNYDNVTNELIPFIEKNYNVSKDALDRAWMGLSMGSMNTQNMINANAPLFGYYGCFSGGCSVNPETEGLDKTHIVIASGTNDTLMGTSDSMIAGVDAINAAGGFASFESVCGAHDFNTWCQTFRILCEKYLWDPAATGDYQLASTQKMAAFTDAPIADSWAYPGLFYAIGHGIMNGVSDTLLKPEGIVTRAQLVTMLYRAAGSPKTEASTKFKDVPTNTWYTDAVAWASENGFVKGVTETAFHPMDKLTREQMAAILFRMEGSPDIEGNLEGFADKEQVSGYAQTAVAWAVRQGIINGIPSEASMYLKPQGNATRAQVATMLLRYFTSAESNHLILDEPTRGIDVGAKYEIYI